MGVAVVTITPRTRAELEAGLDHIRQAPRQDGLLELIVRRPSTGAREVLEAGEFDAREGLKGDTWILRASSRMPSGGPHPHMQVNIMSARAAALVAQVRERWPLAGDQLYVDLDLSEDNLPAWTKLAVGSAILEVTDQPHTGCAKFAARFGIEATQFVNSPAGRSLRLRGLNARVVQPGIVRTGDLVRKV
jgi:MOSC domain-containing protein YiiM